MLLSRDILANSPEVRASPTPWWLGGFDAAGDNALCSCWLGQQQGGKVYITSQPTPALCHPQAQPWLGTWCACLSQEHFSITVNPQRGPWTAVVAESGPCPAAPHGAHLHPGRLLLLLLLSRLLSPPGHLLPSALPLCNNHGFYGLAVAKTPMCNQCWCPPPRSWLLLVLCSTSSHRPRKCQCLKSDWDGEPWHWQKWPELEFRLPERIGQWTKMTQLLLLCWTELLSGSPNNSCFHTEPDGSSLPSAKLLETSPAQSPGLFDPCFLFWAEESAPLTSRLLRPFPWRSTHVSVTLITLLAFPTVWTGTVLGHAKLLRLWDSGRTHRHICHQTATQNDSRGRRKVSPRAPISRVPK